MKVVVPMAEGFEEIEFVTIVDILRRAGERAGISGPSRGPTGSESSPTPPSTISTQKISTPSSSQEAFPAL